MSENLFFHKIDAYLEDSLSAKERALFEAEMEKNKELMLEVEIQKDVVDALRDKDFSQFKEKLDSFNKRRLADLDDPNKKSAKVSPNTLFLVAFGIVGIICLFLLSQNIGNSSEELINEFAGNPPSNICIEAFRGANPIDRNKENYSSECKEIDNFLISKDFQAAINRIDLLNSTDINLVHWSYVKAYCYISLNQGAKAIEELEYCKGMIAYLAEDKRINLYYYLALAYRLRSTEKDLRQAEKSVDYFIENANKNSLLLDKAEKLKLSILAEFP